MPPTLHVVAAPPGRAASPRKRWYQRAWLKFVLAGAVLFCIGLIIAGEYIANHAEPIIRGRVIATLSERFKAPVQLDHLDISLLNGIEVQGSGLTIGRPFTAAPAPEEKPLITAETFSFRTSVRGLLHEPTTLSTIRVHGLTIDLPPGEQRGKMLDIKHDHKRLPFAADQILADSVTLTIENGKPGKDPLEFDIATLKLSSVGPNRPLQYDAQLTNPRPAGQIHAVGDFGPWNADDPRQSSIDGNYTFDHADLGTLKGISGTLSSTGKFSGVLERMTVDGTANVPDFALDISDHPVPLHTTFHAYVDGTSGDTTLDPVQARLLHTSFTCRGTVVKVPHQGHDIALTVDMPNGRVEDLLQLAMKGPRPIMLAAMSMKARLHIPPGQVRVAQKLEISGHITEHNIEFTNLKFQDDLDGLSMRAQGRPQDVAEAAHDKQAEVASQLTTNFAIANGVGTFRDVDYSLPGADVKLNGVYLMQGDLFEFKGHVRTQATASQMVTGWKSLLLRPVDPFLKKNGAGVELPVAITGAKSDLHFGLAMHGTAEESTDAMLAELRAGEKQRQFVRQNAAANAAAGNATQPPPKKKHGLFHF